MLNRVVVIDTAISNYSQLLSGLDSDVNVLLIDSAQDGWLQLGQKLAGLEDIASLHIFSHGGEGQVQLGAETLHSGNLTQYASVLAEIGSHLASGADVLLYGCSVGAEEGGRAFVEQFSAAIGADVAASDNLTGASVLGGDWVLETQVGQIETAALAPQAFEGVLPGSVTVYDNSFEYLGINGWTYIYGGAGYWTFFSASGGYGSGVADNGSPWFSPSTPYGGQALFLQGSSGGGYAGSAQQQIFVGENGALQVTFASVARSGYGAVYIDVKIDGVTVGTIDTASQSQSVWTNFSVTANSVATGYHTLTFTGRTMDGSDHASAIDNIQVTALNDAPILGTPATLSNGTEDTAYIISQSTLLQGWSDIDGGSLSVQNLTTNNGTLVNNGNGTWTLTPAANYNGNVTLSYNVSDGQGGSTATTRSFTLAAVNDAPALTGAPATLAGGTEDTAYTVSQSSLLQGWTDVENGTLSVQNLTTTTGSLVNNGNGTWTLTPGANANGAVTLDYNVSDGQGGSTATSRSFTLSAVNDAPALTGAPATLSNGTEDTTYTISQSSLLQGWTDVEGNTLSVQNLTASNGALVDNGNGAWTLTPSANFNGGVILNYNVSDGLGGSVATSRSFTLAAVNDAPTGAATTVLSNGTEDTAYTVTLAQLTAGFSDAEGNTLSVAGLSANHGSIADNGNG